MARRTTIETGTYRVRFAAHSGLGAYDVAEGLTRSEAVRAIVRLARSRKASGHPTGHTISRRGLPQYEFSEPADCVLIPDTAGIAWVEAETRPAVECWDCGCPVAIGDSCSCQDPIDVDEDAIEDEDDEDEDDEDVEAY